MFPSTLACSIISVHCVQILVYETYRDITFFHRAGKPRQQIRALRSNDAQGDLGRLCYQVNCSYRRVQGFSRAAGFMDDFYNVDVCQPGIFLFFVTFSFNFGTVLAICDATSQHAHISTGGAPTYRGCSPAPPSAYDAHHVLVSCGYI